MKKLLKWLIRIVLTVVVLIVLAAVILPMVIDPNDYKQEIEGKIFDKIGRQVHLNGDIGWKVFPWLALTFNEVKVENEKGFKDDMIAIKQVAARVKIMPLLSKNIEIGQVSLDDALFNLQINKNGRSNWQSIVNKLDSQTDGATGNEKNQAATAINIEGIELNNINLNYTDLKANTRVNISDFSLNTGTINKKDPVDVATDMHVVMPDSGLDVVAKATLEIKNLLSDAGIKINLNDLNINGKMNNNALPVSIEINQGGQIDLGTDSINIPQILMAIGEAKVITNLEAKNFSKNSSQMSGTYRISAFNLNEFLKKLTGAYFVTNDSFDDFSSSGSWSMAGSALKIADLKINFAQTAINGFANINNLSTLKGNFKLDINQLNVDDFLGNEETANSSSTDGSNAANGTPDINFGHLNGNITIGTLKASGTTLQKLAIKVKTNGPKMVLAPIKADFYQGILASSITIDTKATKNRVIVEHNMNKIHAGPLLKDLAGDKLLTGIGDLTIDLNIDKPFSDIPLKTAHGKIKYQLNDGALYGIDVFGMMQKGLSLLYPELKNQDTDGEKKTSFALMQIDADMNQGILTTNVLKIESPYLQVLGDLKIDLVNMTIDGTIEPKLLNIPEQLASDKYKKLLNIAIPVALSGSLLEPKVSIDAKKLLLATQKERIEKEKDKLKDKLIGSLFGKDKKKNQEGKSDKEADKTKPNDDQKEPESDKDKLKKKLLKGVFGGG